MLAELIGANHKLGSVEAIIAAVYGGDFDPASLAPEVIEAARQGDRIAEKILQRGVGELEEHIRIVSSKLNKTQKIHTVLLGGLFSNDSLYSKLLREKITGSLPHIEVKPAQSSAGTVPF